MQREVKMQKLMYFLDLIYWGLHNKHVLPSSGTQIKHVSSAGGRVALCICVQTDLWPCVTRVNTVTVFFPPLEL